MVRVGGPAISYGKPFHLIAIGSRTVRLILVEADQGGGTAIEAFPMPAFCTRELWRWESRARKPKISIL